MDLKDFWHGAKRLYSNTKKGITKVNRFASNFGHKSARTYRRGRNTIKNAYRRGQRIHHAAARFATNVKRVYYGKDPLTNERQDYHSNKQHYEYLRSQGIGHHKATRMSRQMTRLDKHNIQRGRLHTSYGQVFSVGTIAEHLISKGWRPNDAYKEARRRIRN